MVLQGGYDEMGDFFSVQILILNSVTLVQQKQPKDFWTSLRMGAGVIINTSVLSTFTAENMAHLILNVMMTVMENW